MGQDIYYLELKRTRRTKKELKTDLIVLIAGGDLGSIPGLRGSPGEGKGYPLQYSGLYNSIDSIVHGVTEKSDTRR